VDEFEAFFAGVERHPTLVLPVAKLQAYKNLCRLVWERAQIKQRERDALIANAENDVYGVGLAIADRIRKGN